MSRRTGKRNLFDWNTLSQYDDVDVYGVCLTQRQAMILKAALIPAYWSRRWLGFPGDAESRDTLESMIAKIDNQLDGNDCPVCNMEFRDNPLDPCEVQYSNDGGETWETMFRKDVCVPQQNLSISNLTEVYEASDTITTNNTTWNNDITNVAPQWDYDPGTTEKALCFVVVRWVDLICDLAIMQISAHNEEEREKNDWLDDVAVLVAELVMDVIVHYSGFSPSVVFAGAVWWASVQLMEYLWDEWMSMDASHFTDLDARESVACFMFNQLRGETPQWELWRDSLENFDYGSAPLAEQSIASSVNEFNIGDVDTYINYMMLLEDINAITEYLPECPCDMPVIINQLQGPTGVEMYGYELCHSTMLAYSNAGDEQAVCPGLLDIGDQFYYGVASDIGGVGGNIKVVLPPNVLVTKVKVKWSAYRASGVTYGDKRAGMWLGEPNGGGTQIGGHTWGVAEDVWQSITTQVEDPGGIIATPEAHLWLHNSIDRNGGEIKYVWIYVECIPYVP